MTGYPGPGVCMGALFASPVRSLPGLSLTSSQCKLGLGVASVRLWQNRLSHPELEKGEPVSA